MLSLEQTWAVLEVLGYPCTERTLREWSYERKHALPRLRRLTGQERVTAEARYAWDDEVIVQAFTVRRFMDERSRLGDVKLFSWWAGFEHPVEEMRAQWIGWAEREAALKQRAVVDREFDAVIERDTVSQIPAQLVRDHPRRARRLPPQMFTTLTLIDFDPIFNADAMSDAEIDALRRELKGLVSKRGDASLPPLIDALAARIIRKALWFVHRAFSSASLPGVLRTARPEDLEAAHADWSLIAGVFHWWLLQTIVERCQGRGGDHRMTLHGMAPGAAHLGRAFMLSNLALRQAGYARELDSTFRLVRDVVGRPSLLIAALYIRRGILAMHTAATPSVWARQFEQTLHEVADECPDVMELTEHMSRACEEIGDLWRPVFAGVRWRDEPPWVAEHTGTHATEAEEPDGG